MTASHPWAGRKTLPMHDLNKENLLLLGAGHCFRDQVLEACPECDRLPQDGKDHAHPMTGSSLETIRQMVATGLGVTILPCTAAGAERYAQRLLSVVRLRNPTPKRCVALAWRATFPRPKAIEAVRQAIQACQLSCVRFLK